MKHRITRKCPVCLEPYASDYRQGTCSPGCANELKGKYEVAVVLGDVHIPFEDKRALDLVLNYCESRQPDSIILMGDVLDCYEISDFLKDPERGLRFPEEVKEGRRRLEELRKRCPKARITYIQGNHEHRLTKYVIRNAGGLRGLDGLSIPGQLRLEENGITWIAQDSDKFIDTYISLLGGRLLIGHFDMVRKDSGYTAKGLLDQYGCSIIDGHVHSVGTSNKTLANNKLVMAWENGCLCDLHPHYCHPRKWMHAFSVVHLPVDGEGHYFHVDHKIIINYSFWDGNVIWRN